MEGESQPLGTNEEFLASLGASLKRTEGVDVDLANILKTHILKAAPAQNAVAQAKDAIQKLAGERASSPKPEVANG